jgi:hypothetical protein
MDHGLKPVRYEIHVAKKGTMLSLKWVVSRYCKVEDEMLLAADIYQSMVYRVVG